MPIVWTILIQKYSAYTVGWGFFFFHLQKSTGITMYSLYTKLFLYGILTFQAICGFWILKRKSKMECFIFFVLPMCGVWILWHLQIWIFAKMFTSSCLAPPKFIVPFFLYIYDAIKCSRCGGWCIFLQVPLVHRTFISSLQ